MNVILDADTCKRLVTALDEATDIFVRAEPYHEPPDGTAFAQALQLDYLRSIAGSLAAISLLLLDQNEGMKAEWAHYGAPR